MLILLTGRPGAGKSYTAVELCIAPALDLGRPVRSSVPIKVDECRSIWPSADIELLEADEIRRGGSEFWDSIPGGALVIVDEAEQVWPSGVKTSQVDQPTREWVAMHRHHVGDVRGKPVACDVVLVTQGSNDLGAWVRSKIDKTYYLTKLDAVGLDRRYKCEVYQGFQDTQRPRKRDCIRSYTGTYRDEITRLYKSHSKAKDSGPVSVAELRPDKQATVFNSFGFRAGVVAVPLFFVIGLAGLGKAAQTWGDDAPIVEQSEAAASSSAPTRVIASDPVPAPVPELPQVRQPRVQPEPKTKKPVDSLHWRLSGVFDHGGSRVVLLEHRSGAHRRVLDPECSGDAVRLTCVVDGERVAGWTGRQAPELWSRDATERAVAGL